MESIGAGTAIGEGVELESVWPGRNIRNGSGRGGSQGEAEVEHFIWGFAVALLAVAPIVVLLVRRSRAGGDRQARDHLGQLEELSKLTGGLAHEIKNPLSTIKVNLKLIQEELSELSSSSSGACERSGAGEQATRALRKISILQKETDRLEQILEGFLRYIDRSPLELAETDLNEIVSEMLDFYGPQAYSHSITLRQHLYDKPLVCRIDAGMLKQAILNLLINAQQAMEHGGELMITTGQEEGMAVLRISDTGPGIAPEKLDRVFDAYYSSRPHGSGLGLPTAKKIITGHNGSISVESDVGKGSSFTIRLPLCGN